MQVKLVKIGNSFGIRIPKSLIQQYNLEGDIEIAPNENGILIRSRKNSRAGWQEQLSASINDGYQPDEELLEGFDDDFTSTEWQW
jgi:antitoxin MazE